MGGKEHLLVVIHNNPDPDAIMSGEALRHLVTTRFGVDVSVAYGGYIGRAENRALVRKLGIHLKQFRRIRLAKYDVVACIDTQPGAGNNLLSARSRCNIVIDHHPALSSTRDGKAELVVLEPDLGGTATILVEWLNAADIQIPTDLATGLAYAISSETQNMGRETTRADIDAYLSVYVRASLPKLSQIMLPKLPRSYFVEIARALRHARVYRNLICSHLKEVDAIEVVAEMADFLVRHERISWSLCTGRFDDKLILSLRSTNESAQAHKVIRQLVGSETMAGGHGMTAGGYVPLEGDGDAMETRFEAGFAELMGYDTADWKPLLEGEDGANTNAAEDAE